MKKYIKTPAKINLQLDVMDKNNDYHEIYTIMQTVSYYDNIFFDINNKNSEKIVIQSNNSFVPKDEKNLCYKCIKYLKENYNIDDTIKIYIKKEIPIGGGLGGGSGEFFGVLDFLQKNYKLNLSKDEMKKICNMYGSDIGFFVEGGTALCKGRGEKVSKIKNLPECFILLVNPKLFASTKEIYEAYDRYQRVDYEEQKYNFIKSLNKNENIKNISKYFFNALEKVVIDKYPIIDKIKEDLMINGATNSLMTGSGSTVYGIFEDFKVAKKCQNIIREKNDFVTIICKPIF